MINMRRAFTTHTTTTAHLVLLAEGYWDENNEWVSGANSPPVPFSVTVMPVGMAEDSSFGAILEALPEGERIQEYLKFTSLTEMPINSFVYYNTGKFKIIRDAEYSAAGFFSVIGENVRGKDES